MDLYGRLRFGKRYLGETQASALRATVCEYKLKLRVIFRTFGLQTPYRSNIFSDFRWEIRGQPTIGRHRFLNIAANMP